MITKPTDPLYKCPICQADNYFVNQCRCDPNNLPTPVLKNISRVQYMVVGKLQAENLDIMGDWEAIDACLSEVVMPGKCKQAARSVRAEVNAIDQTLAQMQVGHTDELRLELLRRRNALVCGDPNKLDSELLTDYYRPTLVALGLRP